MRKCGVCKRKAKENLVVCSDECQKVRLEMSRLSEKYSPTKGCENCWGDLHQGCTRRCKKEFRESRKLYEDMRSLVELVNKTWRKKP